MIKVEWNDKVCIHSANCVKNLPEVFKVEDGKFEIDEKGASEDAIKAVVADCPSGALKVVEV
ncbi:MAG TPA: (4Fe-4S)-binding protein [Stellaceae bacterium]|nr:(4Fe-4S)-binding protein [Stellaceae bacterium]